MSVQQLQKRDFDVLKRDWQHSSFMAILYFLGGEDIEKRDSSEINKRAFVDAGGEPEVLLFPWTAESPEVKEDYKKMMTDYFSDLGARSVVFADYSDSFEEIERKVESSDLIYLPGGITSVLLKRIRNKNVDALLRKYDGVIVGRSAGALALCEECIVTKRRRNPMTAMLGGIRLVAFNVKVHYHPSRDDELKQLSKTRMIYGIPERSAVIYDNGSLSFIGNICLFQNGEKINVD